MEFFVSKQQINVFRVVFSNAGYTILNLRIPLQIMLTATCVIKVTLR